jgi:hypothetical protein
MSLPVATTISGIDSMEVLDQNLAILRDFKPLSADQMQTLPDHGKQFNDGRYELYKSTLKYDSDLGRSQHGIRQPLNFPCECTQASGSITGCCPSRCCSRC